MRNETRQRYRELLTQIARLNNIPSAGGIAFNVDPGVQQTLESHIQESTAFLQTINVIGVDEPAGQKLGLGTRPHASRTAPDGEREPVQAHHIDGDTYQCVSTEFDIYLPHEQLDAWARHPDFQRRVTQAVIEQQARDRIRVGFNGTHAAAETDPEAYPDLQDLNIGWLQRWRDHAPERVMSGETIEVGPWPGAHIKNLDALIHQARAYLLDPWHADRMDLVAYMPHRMLADRMFPILDEHGGTPTELEALGRMLDEVRVGDLPAIAMPYMPDGTILVTAPQNLSLYWQRGARRRHIIDNPGRSRIEDYHTSAEAYVVEDYGLGCVIEGVLTAEPEEVTP
jgi:P2 family phage major capsid protein